MAFVIDLQFYRNNLRLAIIIEYIWSDYAGIDSTIFLLLFDHYLDVERYLNIN